MKGLKPVLQHTYLRGLLAGIFCYGIFIVMLVSYSLATNPSLKSRHSKAQEVIPAVIPLGAESSVNVEGTVVTNDVTIPDSVSFSSDQTSLPGALEVLKALEDTKFKETTPRGDSGSQVQGDFTNLQVESTTALPADFTKNAKLVRTLDEEQVYPDIAQDHVKHYYFQQQIPVGNEKLPVLGADVRMGLREEGGKSDLLSMTSTVVSSTDVVTGTYGLPQAESKALSISQSEVSGAFNTTTCGGSPQKMIVNPKLLGLSDVDKNIVVHKVSVCGDSPEIPFSQEYFISQESGEAVLTWDNVLEALNREIYDCTAGDRNCSLARREGQTTGGAGDVPKAYDYSGDVYNYFFSNHGRDSYDNRGSKIVGYVNQSMRNAMSSWDGRKNTLYFGRGFVHPDVWAHEYTHGVIFATNVGFGRTGEQGRTLHEAFSDVFGWAVDSDDWELTGVRRMDDPTRRRHPDRLFSSLYNTADPHVNTGILNKSLYLMIEGGTFNGCTIVGSDKKKVLEVIYKAMVTYIVPKSTSNFRDVYTQINRVCSDLHGAGTSECINIKKAMQATEMSLQSPNSQRRERDPNGETCGASRGGPAPTSAATPVPTNVINPGGGRTATPVPTQPIQTQDNKPKVVRSIDPLAICSTAAIANGATKVQVTCMAGQKFELGDGVTCKRSPTEYQAEADTQCRALATGGSNPTDTNGTAPTATPSADLTGTPVPQNPATGSATMTIDVYASLQGITDRIPDPVYQPLKFKLKFVSVTDPEKKYEFLNVPFTALQVQSDVALTSKVGVLWYSRLAVAIPAGNYYLYIKGPKHVQNRIGDLVAKEDVAGKYTSTFKGMALKQGNNLIDLSGITLFAGDLPRADKSQDGIINSNDLIEMKNNLGKSSAEALKICDINLDGICNSIDYKQVIDALANRFDIE